MTLILFNHALKKINYTFKKLRALLDVIFPTLSISMFLILEIS